MPRTYWRKSRRDTAWAICFLLPNFLGFLIFTAGPVIFCLYLAFTEWDLLTPMKFVGLSNFEKLFAIRSSVEGSWEWTDPLFWKYLGNTLFLMTAIPVSIVGSLILALVLSQKLRGIVFFRTAYYLPTITAGVALYILWRYILNSDYGLLNTLLDRFFTLLGFPDVPLPRWLIDVNWAKPGLMIMGFWTGVGGTNMLLYIAGLANIPVELYEAADIDGANRWQKFRYITWSQLAPTTFFIVVMSCIGGLQGGFEQAYIMTQGGPAGATKTIGYYIWELGFDQFQMGQAAAVAWVLFLAIFVVTLANWRFGNRMVSI